ncbi:MULTISPECIES: hypothetical protein [Bacillus]|jgi:branched-subunit amino acid transport protein|uniref:Membrane protein n=1 Tax=Bacillus thuringiensis TaxID=1428 RepID=A0AB33AS63_BACTU|nr:MULTISPECIES: hypothetical protein [Bacillus]AJG74589.1 putative membrane protein [Bacillus thuringiensis]AJH61980.1 putative membrane protein [Bacillus cereus]AJK35269.1 putative membrane protein [Bacillus cereus]EEL18423.1 hypothetical protein bcere0016_8540 [Bacillus cereus 95/8201]EEM79134.1 hypothetical protein bthur0010_8040 [Bacillus thuringiensis serovar pondicheriensis BGSC 4BA1]
MKTLMKLFFFLAALSAIIFTVLGKAMLGIVCTSIFFASALFFSKPRFKNDE